MSKTITVKDETFDRLQCMVSAGLYESIEQVVDGVLRDYDPVEMDAELGASLVAASEELDAGPGIPFTREMSQELLWRKLDEAEQAITNGLGVELNAATKQHIAENARRRFEAGQSPNPDVLPH